MLFCSKFLIKKVPDLETQFLSCTMKSITGDSLKSSNARCSWMSTGVYKELKCVLHPTQSCVRVRTSGIAATHTCTRPSRLQKTSRIPSVRLQPHPHFQFRMHPQNSPKSTCISLQKAQIKSSHLPASFQNGKRVRSPEASYVPVVIVAGFDIVALGPKSLNARAESH